MPSFHIDMFASVTAIPLSLYIHFPWCVRKCPYCDFNSHQQPETIPEQLYIARLIEDLEAALPEIWGRRISSIFMGGGTPSLFSPNAIDALLNAIRARIGCAADIEITLEANPGTVDESRFQGFRAAGINRLSLGVQSFNPQHLKTLGRIHDGTAAKRAIDAAYAAGFDNINIDIMHGLPQQSLSEALDDLDLALSFKPQHLSWYQLTLEPNTVFYKTRPPLPDDELIHDMQEQGWQRLKEHGFEHYEISAFAQQARRARHNLNYWQFGDYLGLGAGAHSKITDQATQTIRRYSKRKQPKEYLDGSKDFKIQVQDLSAKDLPFEFMLNALRLKQVIPFELYESHTFLSRDTILAFLTTPKAQALFQWDNHGFALSPLGQRFANEAMELFLPSSIHPLNIEEPR